MHIDPPYLKLRSWPGVSMAVSSRFSDQARQKEFDLNSNQPDKSRFMANAQSVRKHLKLNGMAGLRQVHGTRLVEVREGNLGQEMPEADGLFTTTPGLGLMIRQADCQAIALFAPGVAANLHVGWRGNVLNLPGQGLAHLCNRFNLPPSRFTAYISPSLGPCCAEFVNYKDEFPPEFAAFMVSPNHFNLWAISAWQLINQGLLRANLSISGICSKCNQDFYSFRRGDEGRSSTVIALKE